MAKYGPGKWRLILSDPILASALRARSNVDLKDKWRNLHAPGWEARSESPSLGMTGGGDGREASSSGRDGAKRRRDGEDEDDDGVAGSVGRVPSGAHEAQVNEMMSEVQRAKREAESALAQLVAAERIAEKAEREAWEAEKLAGELVTEAQRQKVGLPVEGAEDVADVAASLLGENSDASPPG